VRHAEGLSQGHAGPPAVLVALYAVIGVGMVLYVVWQWLARPGL